MSTRPPNASLFAPEVSPQALITTQAKMNLNISRDRIGALQRPNGQTISDPREVITPLPIGDTANLIFDMHEGEPVFTEVERVEVASTGMIDTRKEVFVSFNAKLIDVDLIRLPPKRRQREQDRRVMFLGTMAHPYSLSSSTQAQYGATVCVGGAVSMVPRRYSFTAGFYATVATPRVDPKEREEELSLTHTDANFPYGKQTGVLKPWSPYTAIDEIDAAVNNHLMSNAHARLGFETLDPQSTHGSALETDDEIAILLSRAMIGSASMILMALVETGAVDIPEWVTDASRVQEWKAHLDHIRATEGYLSMWNKKFTAAAGQLNITAVDEASAEQKRDRYMAVVKHLGAIAQPSGRTVPCEPLKSRALGLAMMSFLDTTEARVIFDALTVNEHAAERSAHGYLEESNEWRQLQRLQGNAARDWIRVAAEGMHLNNANCHAKSIQNAPVGVANLFQLLS